VSNDLAGRRALVTGASRGIGRAVARALAAAGVHMAVNYRARAEDAEALRAELSATGVRVMAVQADVSRATDVEAMVVRRVHDELGGVDILVNNAGIARPAAIDRVTEADWDAAMDTNLRSAYLVTQAVLPDMRARQWGRLVFLSSVAAQVGGVVGPHYAASKAGLHGLMHFYARTSRRRASQPTPWRPRSSRRRW
jgi:3-oxoacyl-[acyl-carrier protein] reductase